MDERVSRWAMAVAMPLVAAAVSRVLDPLVAPYTTPPYMLAVMVAAAYGGMGPGLLASAIATLCLAWIDLLSNAVKFTPEGGRVVLLLDRRRDRATIVVTDDGAGIEAPVLPHVFDRFRQGKHRNEERRSRSRSLHLPLRGRGAWRDDLDSQRRSRTRNDRDGGDPSHR